MKKICKNCKYYNAYNENDGRDVIGYGICENPKFVYDCASCMHNKTKDMLLYMDYEGYEASVEMGEEFGCIHFERKEKNDASNNN